MAPERRLMFGEVAELYADMAAVARRVCAPYEHIELEECEFERVDPPPERQAILAEVGAMIDRNGGTFEMPYATVLCLAFAA